jgi:hypothetical protein
MKNIVFVGDSYCSAWAGPSVMSHWSRQQKCIPGDPTRRSWLDVSATKLGLDLYSFGYSGVSWYYSRVQLLKHMASNSDWIKNGFARSCSIGATNLVGKFKLRR